MKLKENKNQYGSIGKRKVDHIDICARENLESIKYKVRTTLLECVELLPLAFPKPPLQDIDTKMQFLSTTINAPLMVSAMTGGTKQAGELNLHLASACQQLGIPFAFGSGRIAIEDPSQIESFKVRSVAPGIPLIANIGIMQAEILPVEKLKWLVEETEADALAIHINFAMELFQPEGRIEKTSANVVETILRIKSEVNFPLIVKEVGCGFSPQQLDLLRQCEIDWVDVAGAGGTNWIKVENLRSDEESQNIAKPFFEWGFPTAACLIWACKAGHDRIIASGGITNGLEVVKAMVLGAKLCGIALPVLRCFMEGGEESVIRYLSAVIEQIKIGTYLCGVSSVKKLQDVPYIITGALRDFTCVTD